LSAFNKVNKDWDALAGYFQEINDKIKRSKQRIFGPGWYELVDLHTMYGYRSEVSQSTLLPDVKSWVGEVAVHEIGGSTQAFLDPFERACQAVVDRCAMDRSANVQPLDSWLEDPNNYITPGSLLISSPVLSKSHRYVRIVPSTGNVTVLRSKWSLIFTQPHLLKEAMLTPYTPFYRVILKREAVKVRGVISSPVAIHLMMTYILTPFESAFRGSRNSTLFMSSQEKFGFWTIFARDGADPQKIKCPIDISKFDHQQTIDMILALLRVLRQYAKAHFVLSTDYLAVFDNLVHVLKLGGYVELVWMEGILKKTAHVRVINGVLSGWRGTALFDTLLNLAALIVVCDLAGSTLLWDTVCSQGDDIRILFNTIVDAVRVILSYQVVNIPVHPDKNEVSLTTDSFLRHLVIDGYTTGFPARAVSALIRNKPIAQQDDGTPFGRLSAWSTFLGRVKGKLNYVEVINRIVADISGLTKTRSSTVRTWLHTPRTLGGGGLAPLVGNITYETEMAEQVTYKWENAPYLKMWMNKLGLPQRAFDSTFANQPIRGAFKRTVTPAYGIHTPYVPTETTIMPKPSYVEFCNKFMLRQRFENIYRNRDKDAEHDLMDKTYTSDTRDFFLGLEKTKGRWVARAWLHDDLPKGIPFIPLFAENSVSVRYRQCWDYRMASALTIRTRNKDTGRRLVTAAAILAELDVNHYYATYPEPVREN
jgi:hypothetical protein